MRVVFRLVLVVAATSLMGCATASAPTAQQACARYGYTPGTDAFAGCMERAERADAIQRQRAMSNAAVLLTPPTFNYPAPPQPRYCQWEGPQWVCR